jgi:hypothetical protein
LIEQDDDANDLYIHRIVAIEVSSNEDLQLIHKLEKTDESLHQNMDNSASLIDNFIEILEDISHLKPQIKSLCFLI